MQPASSTGSAWGGHSPRRARGRSPGTSGAWAVGWEERRWDDGRTLLGVPVADAAVAAFGFPYYQCHRADVQTALAHALSGRLHLGHRLIDLEEACERIAARFDNGARVVA